MLERERERREIISCSRYLNGTKTMLYFRDEPEQAGNEFLSDVRVRDGTKM